MERTDKLKALEDLLYISKDLVEGADTEIKFLRYLKAGGDGGQITLKEGQEDAMDHAKVDSQDAKVELAIIGKLYKRYINNEITVTWEDIKNKLPALEELSSSQSSLRGKDVILEGVDKLISYLQSKAEDSKGINSQAPSRDKNEKNK